MARYCLARTSDKWFAFIKENGYMDLANLWKPYPQSFKTISKDGKIFLYSPDKKAFIDVATFNGNSSIKTVQEAWKYYRQRNGHHNINLFKQLLNGEASTKNYYNYKDKICCIEVENIKEFKEPYKYEYKNNQMFKSLEDNEYKDLLKALKAKEAELIEADLTESEEISN